MKVLIVGNFSETSKATVTNHFPESWDVVIVPPGEEVLQHIKDCQILIPEHIKVDHSLLSAASNLKLVQTGAGFDNVDVDACTQRGIWAANAAGVNAQAVAEHVLALLLSYYKNIPFLDAFMKNKMDENQLNYTGSELAGKTIGIVGLGAIGKKVASFCKTFDMNVLACVRNPAVASAELVTITDFDTLVSTADIISVHTPLTQQTKQLFTKDVFKKMKQTALFINTSRGGIVKEEDLIDALKNRDILGACLDVFESEPLPTDSELRTLNNVVLTPHTAGLPDGRKFHKKRYDFFIQNINRVANGEEPKSKLNQISARGTHIPKEQEELRESPLIESISHITFIVKDLELATTFFKEIFSAKEVYTSGDATFSVSKEKFFMVGNQWIAVMEGKALPTRTYNHVAFKISEADFETYQARISKLGLDFKPPRPRVDGEGRSLYFYDFDNHLFELHTSTLSQRLERYKQK